jgi:hypothetical protein
MPSEHIAGQGDIGCQDLAAFGFRAFAASQLRSGGLAGVFAFDGLFHSEKWALRVRILTSFAP